MDSPRVVEENERSSNFWRVIERELEYVEPFIKHIITVKGYDDREILKNKNEDISDELEAFVKSGEYASKIPSLSTDRKSPEFYGHCAKDPSKFFFMIGNKMKLLEIIKICKNDSLWSNDPRPADFIQGRMDQMAMNNESSDSEDDRESTGSTLLNMLKLSLRNNGEKDENQRTYPDALQKYCTYIYFVGGTPGYEFLSLNLPIPSIETLHQNIKVTNPRVDGEFQIKGLKKFLTNRKLPLNVWISECTVKCVRRLQYNARENEVAGLARHLDENGMPKTYTFTMKNLDDLKRYTESENPEKPATILRCFMAQSMTVDAPPYCLALFGCDQSYSYDDCIKCWDYTAKLLEQEGITVQGFSAENNPRMLKGMRIKSGLGEEALTNATNITGFCAEYMPNQVCVQDPILSVLSVLNKRFLDQSTALTIGDHIANPTHLHLLVDKNSEYKQEKCLFTLEMLKAKSDLNIDTLVKICHPKTIKMLEKVPDTEGTREYLKLVNFISHSYLSTKLSPPMRVYCSWYAVFFLRLWRASLEKSMNGCLELEFIPFDTYVCIELNAHSLVNLILKNMNKPDFNEFFLPWQCSVKPCKQLFKMLRTPDCYYRNAVNCTPLEALRKAQRIELIDDIISYDYSIDGENLSYPGAKPLRVPFEKITSDSLCVNLKNDPILNQELSLSAIQNVIDRAKQDAFQQILKLGVSNVVIEDCHEICKEIRSDDSFPTLKAYISESDKEEIVYSRRPVDNIIEVAEQCLDPEERTVMHPLYGCDYFQDYSLEHPVVKEDDLYVETTNINRRGVREVVLKSSMIYLFGQDWPRVDTRPKRDRITDVCKLKQVRELDWCLFRVKDSEECMIGMVLSFAYMDERRDKGIDYPKDYVQIEDDDTDGSVKEEGIGVLFDRYNVNESRILYMETRVPIAYVDLNRYVCTIPQVPYENEKLEIPASVYDKIKHLMMK